MLSNPSFVTSVLIDHTYDPILTNNILQSGTVIASGSTYFYSVYLTAGTIIQKCDVHIIVVGTTQNIQTSLYDFQADLIISFGVNSALSSASFNTMTASSPVTIATSGFYYIAFKTIYSGATTPKFSMLIPPTGSPSINFKTVSNNVGVIAIYRASSTATATVLTSNLPLMMLITPINNLVYITLS